MSSYFEQRMTEIKAEQQARLATFKRPPPEPVKVPAKVISRGHVYFLRTGNAVKIGHSTNLQSRFKSLKTGIAEEARIVKIVRGGMRDEKAFHSRFAEYRLKGEWFELRGALAKYLERCLVAVPLPEAEPEPVSEFYL